MRVLAVVHHDNAAAGVFAEPALAAGHELVEWLPHKEPTPPSDGFGAAFVFGGEMNVDEEDAHPWLREEKRLIGELIERGTPLLGVCLGSQLVAEAAGAVVRRAKMPEIGWYDVTLTPEGEDDDLLGVLPSRFESFQFHYYEWLLPPGGTALARSALALQAFRLGERPVWGVQFHPEVVEQDLRSWLDDPDVPDPEAIRRESAGKIGAWNDAGRALSARFLEFSRLGSHTPR
jgi:GMP synthase-like glutamine amidotransferase